MVAHTRATLLIASFIYHLRQQSLRPTDYHAQKTGHSATSPGSPGAGSARVLFRCLDRGTNECRSVSRDALARIRVLPDHGNGVRRLTICVLMMENLGYQHEETSR